MRPYIREKIIECAYQGFTLKEIQTKCGSPSKQNILKVIKEYAPDIYNSIGNNK